MTRQPRRLALCNPSGQRRLALAKGQRMMPWPIMIRKQKAPACRACLNSVVWSLRHGTGVVLHRQCQNWRVLGLYTELPAYILLFV